MTVTKFERTWYNVSMNEFSTEICYPEELADPFYEEESGASYEFEEDIK